MEYFDLTLPLGPETPVYPGDPEVALTLLRTHAIDGHQVTRVCLGSHSGTHLDAPRHFFPDGATLDAYPMERLVGQGVVLDVRPPVTPMGSLPGRRSIDGPLLADRLRASGHRPRGFVLLWTAGAFLSEDGVRVLLDADPGLVGTDAPSLDPPEADLLGAGASAEPWATSHLAHRSLLGNGVLLAENLCNLERLGPGWVTCAFLPLALIDTDGAPVRVVAWRDS